MTVLAVTNIQLCWSVVVEQPILSVSYPEIVRRDHSHSYCLNLISSQLFFKLFILCARNQTKAVTCRFVYHSFF